MLLDQEGPNYITWFKRQSSEIKEEWQTSLDHSIESEALEPAKFPIAVRDDSPENTQTSPPTVHLETAVRLANNPYRIFLENDGSDRDFVFTYSNQQQLKKLRTLEKEGLLRFENCGGITELPRKIQQYVAKHPLNSINASAVFDCDASAPNQPSPQSNAATAACTEAGVEKFRLNRRAIENYLHPSWLNTWVNENRTRKARKLGLYKAFCGLSRDQKAHFHMKDGLSKDKEAIAQNTLTLYNNVSQENRRKLNSGFGARIAELYAKDWIQEKDHFTHGDTWTEVNGIVTRILALSR
ncbi:hypothetical protein PUV47_05110 [Pseudovibrio exalbescens]|uniref:hypothetical protein n=1 Tax=Pseudovibrio exalbescens TaxID=197461 RepID=UPI00236723DB|nr:hypothetical protein [Pseudovibrio exalbescens]MDD7909288.1 hypothetical protein [Pseudovibrio exalbescens]